jgi:hypothetical protein
MIVIEFYDIIVKLGFAWFGGKELMDTWLCEIIEKFDGYKAYMTMDNWLKIDLAGRLKNQFNTTTHQQRYHIIDNVT